MSESKKLRGQIYETKKGLTSRVRTEILSVAPLDSLVGGVGCKLARRGIEELRGGLWIRYMGVNCDDLESIIARDGKCRKVDN